MGAVANLVLLNVLGFMTKQPYKTVTAPISWRRVDPAELDSRPHPSPLIQLCKGYLTSPHE